MKKVLMNKNKKILEMEYNAAYDIFSSKKKPNHLSDYEFYIKLLEENNIKNGRENVNNKKFRRKHLKVKKRQIKIIVACATVFL